MSTTGDRLASCCIDTGGAPRRLFFTQIFPSHADQGPRQARQRPASRLTKQSRRDTLDESHPRETCTSPETRSSQRPPGQRRQAPTSLSHLSHLLISHHPLTEPACQRLHTCPSEPPAASTQNSSPAPESSVVPVVGRRPLSGVFTPYPPPNP